MPKIRVLLAEDHQTVREGLRLIINAQPDMEVIGEASDGQMAVQQATALSPEVVVMDVSMPKLNGVRATEELKRCCPEVKVLTLTRHGDDEYLQQLMRVGVAGYILKQSHSSELLNGIRAIAGGGKYLDPKIAGRVMREFGRPTKPPNPTSDLTPREEEVLKCVALGYTNKEIAERLTVSVKTVETHKANGMHKLSMRSRIDVVRFAVGRGWLSEA